MDELYTRRDIPYACVVDRKHHVCRFLRALLAELGFRTCGCCEAKDLSATLEGDSPDLVVIGLSTGTAEAKKALRTLAAQGFVGKALLFGTRDSGQIAEIQAVGKQLGVDLLPPLAMPLRHSALRDRVAALPAIASSRPPIDLDEAARAGWIELWYQPKIDTQDLIMRGTEAVPHVRHPDWGIVPVTHSMRGDYDSGWHPLSETLVERTLNDWDYIFARKGPIETAINLPLAFLQEAHLLERLCEELRNYPAFAGLIIEVDGTDIVRNLSAAKDIAKRLRFHKIGISIDNLGIEWPLLTGHRNFPFVEIKIDRKLVLGCADDPFKQKACRHVHDLAQTYGARTVAKGVENWADFLTLRSLGFDLAQGSLFAKPLSADKFVEGCWSSN